MLEHVDATIALQEQSLKIAIAQKEAARGTELAVQRFEADVAKNRSEKLIVYQEMVEAENRIRSTSRTSCFRTPALSTWTCCSPSEIATMPESS